MKKRILSACLLLAYLASLLCGCNRLDTQEETRSPWPGYEGVSWNYTYYYQDGRDREWEEDVIFLADNYLDDFGLLTPYNSCIETPTGAIYTNEVYSEEQREAFLDEINALIPEIQNMTGNEILFELQRIVAAMKDLHTCVILPTDQYYPIFFEIFYEEQQPRLYVTHVPEAYEDAVFGRLESINGVPLEEVLEKSAPYIPHENYQSLLHYAAYILTETNFLKTIGLIRKDSDSVTYGLTDKNGQPLEVELDAANDLEWDRIDWVGHDLEDAFPQMYKNGEENPFWYEMFPEEDMIYIRISQFDYLIYNGIMDLGNNVLKEVRNAGGVHKLVLDLRYNPGGSQGYGYDQFISVLQRMEVDDIYVLVNEGSYSNSINTASLIKVNIPEAILVGTPAGQPPNFFASIYNEDYIMPNCGVEFRLPQAYWRSMPDYPHDALMPDMEIYPSVQNFMDCEDITLDAVLALP